MVRLDLNTPDPFEIVVGTYEQYLLGYKVRNIVNEYKMERSFATHSHLASVRCVGSNKHYLASGGSDDSVYLYDMRYRTESGKLIHHNDTVNCVAFTPEASHIFTCSSDGSIAALRCGNWQMEKHWQKSHKGLAVNTLAIHPTGKIALSAGADGILRTWNLVKGRQAYATNLIPRLKLDAKNVTVLKWSPNGEKYLLAVNQRIDIYSVEVAGIDNEIKFDSKIVCVEFLKDDLIAVGLENGQIKLYDLEKSVQTVDTVAHDIRVKCMAFVNDLLVTASSSGEIKLWRYSTDTLDMLHTVNCGARITCLSLVMPCKNLVHKEEDEVKEEKEVRTRKKFRMRQEVIIEDERDCEIIPTDTLCTSSSKKKLKKRCVEETQSSDAQKAKKKKLVLNKRKHGTILEEEIAIDHRTNPKEKCIVVDNDHNGSTKKRKSSASLEENNDMLLQKAENFNCKPSQAGGVTFKRIKNKLASTEDTNNIVPRKKTKKSGVEKTVVTMKKKKEKRVK